jgi:hypothetical protein
MTDIEDLESKLLKMYSHRGDGILTQYTNPDGPAAVATIQSLQAEVAALREGLAKIDALLERTQNED